jgi:dihydroxy-acid dehydratase
LPLRDLVPEVAAGIREAGGLPVAFPVMSLGEDLMKPSAMLYRNLLSVEVEEYLRSYPLDGVVLLANCDKSVPGALMGSVSADLPTVMVTGGARPVAQFHGRRVGTGTDLWRALDDHRAGRMSDEEWAEFERCLNCGLGSCNTMGTATSMAIVAETLGFSLPGTATLPAADQHRPSTARAAGRRVVAAVVEDARPARLMSAAALRNAVRVLHACGGSTNAILHLLALAGRSNAALSLDDIGRLGKGVPVLADLEPSGRFLVQDLHAAGGLPVLMRAISDHLELEAYAGSGQSWREVLETWPESSQSAAAAIRPVTDPLRTDGAFAVVRGSLAPDGAVVKTSAASPELARHCGRAVVFHDYHDMRARIDDPDLDVTPDDVLVLAGCGPVGVPGMPEWGMIPIPARLAAAGVRDMVRVTDARMSGTSFGTCVLHVAPEAAIGGPLALVRDGDPITLDIDAGRLDIDVPRDEFAARRANWAPPVSPHLRGWPALYQAHVTQANLGCDLDFLAAPTPAHRTFVPPIVGRS